MEFRVLALGDVTSEDGTRHLARTLRPFQKVHGVDFTVVNGENVSGVGLTPDQAEDLFAAGADVITLGNHTWGKMQIADYLEDSPYILRPANFSPRTPGRGVGIYDCGRFRIRVISLIGRCDGCVKGQIPACFIAGSQGGRHLLLTDTANAGLLIHSVGMGLHSHIVKF